MFLGLSMVQQSVRETDLTRKEEIVQRAVCHLLADPTRFDIQAVAPQLARDKQFPQISHLCLEKIKILPAEVIANDDNQLFELLNIVVDIVDALTTSLQAGEGPNQGT